MQTTNFQDNEESFGFGDIFESAMDLNSNMIQPNFCESSIPCKPSLNPRVLFVFTDFHNITSVPNQQLVTYPDAYVSKDQDPSPMTCGNEAFTPVSPFHLSEEDFVEEPSVSVTKKRLKLFKKNKTASALIKPTEKLVFEECHSERSEQKFDFSAKKVSTEKPQEMEHVSICGASTVCETIKSED